MKKLIHLLLILFLLLASIPVKGSRIVCDYDRKDNPLVDPETQCRVIDNVEANIPETDDIEIYICDWDHSGNYYCKEI